MTNAPAQPFKSQRFTIYAADPAGLNVVTSVSANAWTTAPARTLLPGDELDVDADIIAANADRNGDSWLTLDADAQRARWGKRRFGIVGDDLHAETRLTALRAERDRLAAERQASLIVNPQARKALGALGRVERMGDRVDALDAEIDALIAGGR